jgi:hypothetical protein
VSVFPTGGHYDISNCKPPQRHGRAEARASAAWGEVDHMGNLYCFGAAIRSSRSLPHQVVTGLRRAFGHCFIAAVLGALAISPVHALDAKDFTDVTLRTGAQLKARLDQAFKNQNVGAAARYFEERKLLMQYDGLAEIRFRTVTTKESYDLFFIPFAESSPAAGLTHLAVSAEGPKGSRVIVATISTEGQETAVKEENVVVDGKVQPPQPGQAFLRNWLKCSLAGCAQALACVLMGPGWPACICLSCGASVIGCGVVEYLFT